MQDAREEPDLDDPDKVENHVIMSDVSYCPMPKNFAVLWAGSRHVKRTFFYYLTLY